METLPAHEHRKRLNFFLNLVNDSTTAENQTEEHTQVKTQSIEASDEFSGASVVLHL